MKYVEIETSDNSSALIGIFDIVSVIRSGTHIIVEYSSKKITIDFYSNVSNQQVQKNRDVAYAKIKKLLEKL